MGSTFEGSSQRSSVIAATDVQTMLTEKRYLERMVADAVNEFGRRWPGVRFCVLHEWQDLRRVGEHPAEQAAHSITVQVTL